MKIIPIILLLQLFVFIGFSQSSDSKLITDSLHSEVLDETRTFCVYFPPFFDSQKKYAVIYCADGQKITEKNKVNFHSTPYTGGHKDLEWIREFTDTMMKIHS